MTVLIDTNIAIYLRDVEPSITLRVHGMIARPRISIMTWVELEGGVHANAANAARRRTTLDTLLDLLEIEAVDADVVSAYGDIVEHCGFSRSRVKDRLIAATAIVQSLTLVTINGDDFRDIPGLALEIWPAPAQ